MPTIIFLKTPQGHAGYKWGRHANEPTLRAFYTTEAELEGFPTLTAMLQPTCSNNLVVH